MTETTLTRLTEHVYWMTPGAPDRPSLGAVVGAGQTLMLDAAASAAHMRLFLDALAAEAIPAPRLVALTHWHWDHVFGAAALDAPVIAQRQTRDQLAALASLDWSDSALDARVASGEEIAFCADNIKLELPEPRQIEIVPPQIVFNSRLEIHLGEVTCHLVHVGGDHAADSVVVLIEPDGVLFLGDCLYDAIYTPARHYTVERLYPLLDKLAALDANQFIEGHSAEVMTRAEFEAMSAKMRFAGALVDEIGADETAALAAAQTRLGQPPDEDTDYFIRAFVAGRHLAL